MMKEGIRGLRPSYKQDKQSALRTFVGGAQAAIEFKILKLNRRIARSFTLKGRDALAPRGGLTADGRRDVFDWHMRSDKIYAFLVTSQ